MSANTPIWCKVLVKRTEWVQVSAANLAHAESEAMNLPGVYGVIESSYSPPPDTADGGQK